MREPYCRAANHPRALIPEIHHDGQDFYPWIVRTRLAGIPYVRCHRTWDDALKDALHVCKINHALLIFPSQLAS